MIFGHKILLTIGSYNSLLYNHWLSQEVLVNSQAAQFLYRSVLPNTPNCDILLHQAEYSYDVGIFAAR